MEIEIKKEGERLAPGGLHDKTKVVAPDLITLPNGIIRMFYVGISCDPAERSGYRLLSADSKDGLIFNKNPRPILNDALTNNKQYSPCVRQVNGIYKMYFSNYESGKYIIRSASSNDCLYFKLDENIIVGTNEKHQQAVHTPKIIFNNGLYYCYYTGSNISEKIYSKDYPAYDFSDGFRIFRAVSKDGQSFKFENEIKSIQNQIFLNYYGHNVILYNEHYLLFYAAFDGSVNRIYISKSRDGIIFTDIKRLLEPDKDKFELGFYSCGLMRLNDGKFRIYYGIRYFDNTWKIHSAVINLHKYV